MNQQEIQPGQVKEVQMIKAQQVQPGQVTVSPYAGVAPAQDIGTLLSSIMPLIMLMMVMMMITPMMKGMAKGFTGEGKSSSSGHSSTISRGRMFEKNYEYVITPKGIAENESFRGKVERWLDGSVFAAPYSTREGNVLSLFARYPGVGLTLDNIWDKQDEIGGDMVPMMISDTCIVLEKRGLIRKVD